MGNVDTTQDLSTGITLMSPDDRALRPGTVFFGYGSLDTATILSTIDTTQPVYILGTLQEISGGMPYVVAAQLWHFNKK